MASSNRKGKGKIREDDDRPVGRVSHPESSRGSRSVSSVDDSLSDPTVEASSMIGSRVFRLRERYHILKQFQLYASNPNDRVNSSPLGQMATYVEYRGLIFVFRF